jgi:hypothetical protein
VLPPDGRDAMPGGGRGQRAAKPGRLMAGAGQARCSERLLWPRTWPLAQLTGPPDGSFPKGQAGSVRGVRDSGWDGSLVSRVGGSHRAGDPPVSPLT